VRTKSTFLAIALALAAASGGAQTVYRCGSSYGQKPCPGGSQVDVSDPVTGRDTARAGKATQSDMKRADAMAREREAQEKNAPKALVIGPATPMAANEKPAKGKTKDKAKKSGENEPVTAVAPKPPGESKKSKP
jgi:hypothetical protein